MYRRRFGLLVTCLALGGAIALAASTPQGGQDSTPTFTNDDVVRPAPAPTTQLDQAPDDQASMLQVKGENVRVRLLDAFSGDVIANSDVDISSDNGIRCIQPPCPTNHKQWRGRSDANGYVVIPTNILQQDTAISTPAFKGGKDLISGSEKDRNGAWVIELYPNRTFDSTGPFLYRQKLVDAGSDRPLINTQVRVVFDKGEIIEGKTNSLGYIFFPLAKGAGDDAWVVVTGYKRTKINWGWVNYKMKLEKQ